MRLIHGPGVDGLPGAPEVDAAAILNRFRPCARPDLDAILSRRRLCRGQMLLTDGDPADFAYGVLSGGVKLLKSLADGRTQMTGYLLPGDVIGLPLGDTYPYSLEAFADTALSQFPRRGLEAIFDRHPELRLQFLKLAYDQLAAAQNHMLLLGRMNMMERICSFLVALLGRIEGDGGPMPTIRLPLLRGEIGELLGMTIESVSRGFSRLQKYGLIAIRHTEIIDILDRASIYAIASGDERRRATASGTELTEVNAAE